MGAPVKPPVRTWAPVRDPGFLATLVQPWLCDARFEFSDTQPTDPEAGWVILDGQDKTPTTDVNALGLWVYVYRTKDPAATHGHINTGGPE